MQESNNNCQRFSAQPEQQNECSTKSKRVRCCGRVISEQEFTNEFSKNCQGKGQGKRMNQGQGQGKRLGQGQGKKQGNCQA